MFTDPQKRACRLIGFTILLALSSGISAAQSSVVINAKAAATPFPHFWEKMFGSGRAALALRESYRNDLRAVKQATDFQYIRFHAILHDELGVYDEDKSGNPVYNFSYIDQIYDGLLSNGVRPVVEISFMPRKLASKQEEFGFWYKPIAYPPKDYAKWDDLMRHMAQHQVDRYGIDEVSQWYFEVWNEPNIDFWMGDPKQPTYFELYDHTARDLKAVNARLRVGGPATAAAGWVDDFLRHAAEQKAPVDFVSSHGYADDTVENLFHSKEDIPMNQRVCRAIKKVHDQIAGSQFPKLPLLWTEWNVPSYDELHARDTIYVGPALAYDILQCDGLVDALSYWTFSDVFEEGGVVKRPFEGQFGLIAAGGIKKPSYNAYKLLHTLGTERIANANDSVLVTKRGDGTLVVATWNLVEPIAHGNPRVIRLQFEGVKPDSRVSISRVDETHGNTMAAYKDMGEPQYPTLAQIAKLNAAAELAAPEHASLKNGVLELDLPVNGLALIEIPSK